MTQLTRYVIPPESIGLKNGTIRQNYSTQFRTIATQERERPQDEPIELGVIMKLPNHIHFALTLSAIASVLCTASVTAEGQTNRHSFESASNSTFSFEQHASDYADATWVPDNEIEISAQDILSLLPKRHKNKQLKSSHDNKTQFKALVSDKSFGIAAQLSF